ncbi:hypothetical protein [Legionella quateirensis]|uniref:Uncharacterized protein n=1 Tax=Legionella quateirensis TaxID=45072 RepID=A0A378KTE1_9GAMM|nr:hypothetical protein [Legionella quateirensis]KTD50942.1 hypothetical protein Lqua_1169 [Legionella quateirensis]STY17812.1 Uncharacterised protein [Legionella quateirensis]
MSDTNKLNHMKLEEEYIRARKVYCEAMMGLLSRASELMNETPINEPMKQAIIKSCGVTIQDGETQDDFEERFEDTMGQTVDEYADFVLTHLKQKLEPARHAILFAANKELDSLTSGTSGTARKDFQETIHEGAEAKTTEVAKCLPEHELCVQAFNRARETYRDSATNLIEGMSPDELEDQENLNNGPRF